MKKKQKREGGGNPHQDGLLKPEWPKVAPMPISEEDLARMAKTPKTALVSFGEAKQWIELLGSSQTVDRLKREVAIYVPSDAIAFVNGKQVDDGNYLLQHNDWLEFRSEDGSASNEVGPSESKLILNDLEQDIIDALADDTLIGEKIAERAKRNYDSTFKSALASLRRRGILGNKSPGYYRL
jgi:hypothetical protein